MEIEQWANLDVEVEGVPSPPAYAISSFGQIKSFQKKQKGEIIKGSVIQGYRSLCIKLSNGKSFNRYLHKAIAEAFLEKPSEKHLFVIHLDYDKLNNKVENLKWVTQSEMFKHHKSNPNVLKKKKTKRYKLPQANLKSVKNLQAID